MSQKVQGRYNIDTLEEEIVIQYGATMREIAAALIDFSNRMGGDKSTFGFHHAVPNQAYGAVGLSFREAME